MPSGDAVEISPGVWMPRLGLGTFKIRGEDATRSTLDALRSGCRHIDTASCYRNEEEVRLGIDIWRSEAAADVDGRGGNEANDDDVFITSKLAPNEMGETRVHAALDGVYERLGRGNRSAGERRASPLDLALVHWPGMARTPPDSPANRTARAETWRALEDALASRAVRAIGVSNYTRTHLLEMRDYARVFPAVNQVEFHPRCQQRSLRRTCEALGVGIVAYSPLGCGELLKDARVLRAAELLAEASGTAVSPARALIAWSLRQPGIVALIVKSSDGKRIAHNVGREGYACAAALAEASGTAVDAAFRELDGMDDGTHFCWDPAVVR
mmetsp:Transcript_359/g.1444  ORF Transcript_359/g.1444 Transcript_359/m.1444 type:complete len:327 (-) Transcript_359:885-1865(-)